jgi:hypothetical protein
MDFNDVIEKFNNGDLDVEKYFNDYSTFFTLLNRRGLMHEIDPHNSGYGDAWQNEYLLWLYSNDKELFNKWVLSLLNDVFYKDGIPYLRIEDIGDLSNLFCGNRNTLSKKTIADILSGEDWEPYFGMTDDVYDDIVKELLDKDNLKHLGEYIVSNLEGQEIEPETDLLYEISESQETDNPTINYENVLQVINDKETLKYLLNDYLTDLESQLSSIYSIAYNDAYIDGLFDKIFKELSTYFIGRGEYVSRPHKNKKNTEVENFIIPIDNFESNIVEFLLDNKGYSNTGTLEYFGSYISVLQEWGECLHLYPPDYPDYDRVYENINSYFKDYI